MLLVGRTRAWSPDGSLTFGVLPIDDERDVVLDAVRAHHQDRRQGGALDAVALVVVVGLEHEHRGLARDDARGDRALRDVRLERLGGLGLAGRDELGLELPISAPAIARSSSAGSTAAAPIGWVLPPIVTSRLCTGLAMRA